MTATTWMENAECRNHDPALWFPLPSESPMPAMRICRTCVVQIPCAQYALDTRATDGVYAGMLLSTLDRNRRSKLAKRAARKVQNYTRREAAQ